MPGAMAAASARPASCARTVTRASTLPAEGHDRAARPCRRRPLRGRPAPRCRRLAPATDGFSRQRARRPRRRRCSSEASGAAALRGAAGLRRPEPPPRASPPTKTSRAGSAVAARRCPASAAGVGVQSTPHQGVELDRDDHAHLWRRYALPGRAPSAARARRPQVRPDARPRLRGDPACRRRISARATWASTTTSSTRCGRRCTRELDHALPERHRGPGESHQRADCELDLAAAEGRAAGAGVGHGLRDGELRRPLRRPALPHLEGLHARQRGAAARARRPAIRAGASTATPTRCGCTSVRRWTRCWDGRWTYGDVKELFTPVFLRARPPSAVRAPRRGRQRRRQPAALDPRDSARSACPHRPHRPVRDARLRRDPAWGDEQPALPV